MRFGLAMVVMIGTAMVVGRTAEAQARGTLQATATVVDTRQGFEALSLVQQTVTDSRIQSSHTVATVAEISKAQSSTDPRTVVVTVDYSRN